MVLTGPMDLLEDPEGSGVSVPVSAELATEPLSKEADVPHEASATTEPAAGGAPAAAPAQAASPFATAASTAPEVPKASLPGSLPLGSTAVHTGSSSIQQQVLTSICPSTLLHAFAQASEGAVTCSCFAEQVSASIRGLQFPHS